MLLTLVFDFAQVTLPRWTPGRRDQTRLGDGFVKAASSTGSAATLVGQCEVGKKHEKIWENHGGATHFSQKNIAQRKIMHTVSKKRNMGGKLLWTSKNYLPKNNKTIGECPSPNHLQPVQASATQLATAASRLSELSILAKARQSWPRLSRGAAGLLGPLAWAVWNLHLKSWNAMSSKWF